MSQNLSSAAFVIGALRVNPLVPKHRCTTRKHVYSIQLPACGSQIENKVIQMYCYYKCSVALPRSAVGLSAVCDCGIS